jgi:transcriptional regulator with XRE-family HTH domain
MRIDATSGRVKRWGEWIVARSRAVGFRRQKDLAQAVGCSEDQLSRWAQSAEPPARITKGFDTALARALQLPKRTVFVNWRNEAPDAEPFLTLPDHAGEPTEEMLAQETLLSRVTGILFPDEVNKVLDYAITLGLSRNDRWLPNFQKIRDDAKALRSQRGDDAPRLKRKES